MGLEFIEWIIDPVNRFENTWSLLSIVLSAAASLIISAVFFHMGNRSNAKVSLLLPVKDAIERPSKKGAYKDIYEEVKALSRSYCIKYLNAEERLCVDELCYAYEKLRLYDRRNAEAQALFDYFVCKLEQNEIVVQCCPLHDCNHNILDYGFPPGLDAMVPDLEKIIKEYDDCDFDDDWLRARITNVLNSYAEEFFPVATVRFFDNCTIDDAIAGSRTQKEWDEKFRVMEQAKRGFLGLKSLYR